MTAAVLTVDDASDLRALVRAVLESRGYAVVEAPSGRDALQLLAQGLRPDAIVLDVQMPDLDGWDTLSAIRADARLAGVPVILCTVRAQQADIDRGWLLGCDAFLGKPFAIDDLARAVTDVCERTTEDLIALRAQHRSAVAT